MISKRTSKSGNITILFSALCLVILFEVGIFSTVYALEIRVKDQATVSDDTVYLRDIASFYPTEDARVSRLSRIEVASAPSPGKMYRFNKQFLNYKIGSAIKNEHDIRLDVPGAVVIKRSAQLLDKERLEDIFREHILNHAPWPEERISFERIRTPGDISLPEGELSWEVLKKGGRRYAGNIGLVVSLWVDGKQIRKVPVSGKVNVSQDVVRSIRRIKRGQIIGPEDVETVTENRRSLPSYILTNREEVVGKKALRNIQPGKMITLHMVKDPPVVKKGKRVMIKAESDSVRVTTYGKVLEDGRVGDQVRVINISSGKEILTTVKGPGLVVVNF